MITPVDSPDIFPRLLELQTESILGLTDTYTPAELKQWVDYIQTETADRYAAYFNAVSSGAYGELQGFVSWTEGVTDANVECLYVREGYRGQGIGQLLLRHAEADLTGKTVHIRSTLNAQPFYENRGYKFISRTISRAGLEISELEKQM